uniref:dipeptidyl aminopeptidase 4 n=1 Tax=Erigeron canadensis TaxID=72917 RepID=UPI001CB8E6C1|nr:dipeptidyl aminopeptidase 4 [Erigeron canadensis]
MQSGETSVYNKKLKLSSSSSSSSMPQPLPSDAQVPFSIDNIVEYPLPGYASPTCVTFSPDDNLISYLFSPDQSLNRKVFIFDLTTCKQQLFFTPPDGGLGEDNLSEQEKFRRERLRERGLGVTSYEWVKTSSKKTTIMVPLPAGIYFMDRSLQPQLKLSSDSSPIVDPHLSPDGTMLAYIKNHELHALDLLYNRSKRLTSGANGTTKMHAVAEYIAQEEMDRKNGYWWSPDSKCIAFTEVDSSEIPLYRIMHQGKSTVGLEAQEDHAYPFAGASNVKVRLGVVPVIGGPVTWMDLSCGGDGNTDEEYLARVNWMRGNILVTQILNRSHSKLKLLKFDIKTGQGKCILVEEHEMWVNLHDCFTPLDKGGGFLWASEKTGFRHLYLHDEDGFCIGPITQGEWMVEQIVGVNEASGFIYFTGTLDGPLECHLYRAKLFPQNPVEKPVKLTREKGKHVVVLDHKMQKFVDSYDSLDSPPRVLLCSLHDGSLIMSLYEQQPSTIPRVKKLQLEPPKIYQIQAKDGTVLYGALYKPDEEKFGPPPYNTMISMYGGPGVQLVSDSWANTVDMRAQYLRSKGILVWKMDNRGSSRRGLAFEAALKHNFGRFDAEDQVSGAEWLIKEGLANSGHIGLYGWSYGGYLSAITLSRFPDVFKCAVSGAPVTSWDGYDSFYTEKYMGTPEENESGYSFGSVMNHVSKLDGKLLLVHGLIDENVHFRHTARLVNALVGARKGYELLIFPDARHMPRPLKDRLYMEERIWDFIQRSL